MRRYWNSNPRKLIDIDSWSPVIDHLISKVSQSQDMTACFREKYPDLLPQASLYSIRDRNRRGQAKAWLSIQSREYLLVKGQFQKLGYKTLEEVCEECGGFVRNDRAEPSEDKGFEILENITRELYSGFFACNQEFPMRKIICNESASYHGMAKVYRKNKPVMNARGLSIRYEIGEIYLKRSVFFFQRLFRCTGDLYTRDVSCLWWRFLQCFQPRADSCDGNTACQCSGDRGLQAAVAEAI